MPEIVKKYNVAESAGRIPETDILVEGEIQLIQGDNPNVGPELFRVNCNQTPDTCPVLGLKNVLDRSHRCLAVRPGNSPISNDVVVFCGKLPIYEVKIESATKLASNNLTTTASLPA